MYGSVSQKFETALKMERGAEGFKDLKLYKPEEIRKYGSEFLAYVDPGFVQDMVRNKKWYEENIN